ncbi:MAG: 23S rRNA (pseudouridine(1915)-N(3))-methyltransferase RlmH [Clostridiales Family XIII bacterium]|jgi:23S rRNA (pseudouridine1915-N3)-methyltransferase|nr:23S rRNA (pseudouridine(1915)-N(3))-methyltransferase RlmH [Clostridiales Family XIII bacterium]
MKIEIICVGNLKEKYWREAASEYEKRLGPYVQISIREIKEVRLPQNAGKADEEMVKEKEGLAILEACAQGSELVALCIDGKKLTSEKFAGYFSEAAMSGKSHITFIIGGSLGLSSAVIKRASLKLSFSDMTFPHQLMRVILLEQIYRAYKIQRGEPYHK